MKILKLTLIAFLIGLPCMAQNVVNNGGFEAKIGNVCPYRPGFDPNASPLGWVAHYYPTYLYPCAAPGSAYYPGSNSYGCENPLEGQSYLGIIAQQINNGGSYSTDFVSQHLNLYANQRYYVEFWVSAAEGNNSFVKNLGMYFTPDQPIILDEVHYRQRHPQVPATFPTTAYSTTNGWTKISGYFKPNTDGGWYILIGNFDPGLDSNPLAPNSTPNTGNLFSYYYIDGITIIPDNQTPPDYTPTVAGADAICSSGTYSIPNLPFGTTATWQATPSILFSTSSGTGNTFTPVASGSSHGAATITATVTGGCGSVSVSPKQIWLGAPDAPQQVYLASTEQPVNYFQVCTNSLGYRFYINQPSYVSSYSWSLSPATASIFSAFGNYVDLALTDPDTYQLFVSATNACGTSGNGSIILLGTDCGGGFGFFATTYPNPATSSITLQVKDSLDSNPHKDKLKKEYEVHLLDRSQKKLISVKSNDKTLTLSTEGIPPDTYYLHIYYKDAVIRKQVVIKR